MNNKNRKEASSKMVISSLFILAFFLFRYLLHEAHEFSHMISGRWFAGTWGSRDFNNVQPFTQEATPSMRAQIMVALAGPIINYVGCWIGAVFIVKAKKISHRAFGIALIFACLPFARAFTALMGGGDELGVARLFIQNAFLARAATVVIVIELVAYPLYLTFKALPSKQRFLNWLGFLLLPMIAEGLVVQGILNPVLKAGVGAHGSYFGAPMLVIAVLLVFLLLFSFIATHLYSFIQLQPRPAQE